MTGPRLSRVPRQSGPLVSSVPQQTRLSPTASQAPLDPPEWPEAASGNWSGCSVEKLPYREMGRQQKAGGARPCLGPQSRHWRGPQATVVKDSREEREAEGRFWGQEQEGGVPRAEQNLMGSGGHHGGRCSRYGTRPSPGGCPHPQTFPSPVKLLWTQRCPWSWEEGWMSTEEAGAQGPRAGAIRPGPALRRGDSQLGWGYMSAGPEAFPHVPCLRGTLAGGGRARRPPGPGARVSHGQQRASLGSAHGSAWLPGLSNAPTARWATLEPSDWSRLLTLAGTPDANGGLRALSRADPGAAG